MKTRDLALVLACTVAALAAASPAVAVTYDLHVRPHCAAVPPIFGATWGASCTSTTTDYAIYEGQLGDWTSHQVIDCSDGGAPFVEPVGLLEGGDNYYLIVPLGADEEGSYGKDSSGLERPPASGATCAPVQVLAACP